MMATLSLRIRDGLKHKAQGMAKRQGVSLNNFINAVLAAAVAQEDAMAFFDDRLRGQDIDALRRRVLGFMAESQSGEEPSLDAIRHARGQE
jgi:antitoxin component of RelBE/YafQ-DinJ toxin-antitoxin module